MPLRPQSLKDIGKFSNNRDSILLREYLSALTEAVQALATKLDADSGTVTKTYRAGVDALVKIVR